MDHECGICKNAVAKYACPKCKVQYCSVKCYQSQAHSTCSEEFYRNCVQEELTSRGPNLNQADRKILEALKRLNEDDDEYEDIDSDDEADEVDLAERIASIDLDNPDQLWNVLTDEEKAEFKKMLASGAVAETVPLWIPWWEYRSTSKVLEDEAELEEELEKRGCPRLVEHKKLSEIMTKPPSTLVQFNVFNVLFAYCYVLLVYNGDVCDFREEAVANLLKISRHLSDSINFSSADEAVEDAVQQTHLHPELQTSMELVKTAREGVRKIVSGPHILCGNRYLLAAFSDMKCLLESLLKAKKGTQKSVFEKELRASEKVEGVDRKKVKILVKKIDFLISWASEYGSDFSKMFVSATS